MGGASAFVVVGLIRWVHGDDIEFFHGGYVRIQKVSGEDLYSWVEGVDVNFFSFCICPEINFGGGVGDFFKEFYVEDEDAFAL